MLKRSSPWNLLTARSTAAQNTRNWMLSCGVSPGFSRLLPELVAHAPVQVLAGAVDAGERLLVQQAGEAELRRHPPQHLHRHHLVIGGDVGVLEDRRDFVLARRDLVVARLDRDADLVELALDFHHEREHAIGDGAEVVVLHLLALRAARAPKSVRPALIRSGRLK